MFVEMLPLVPLLTDPYAHGIDGSAFDVVIPSLPGYGFSQRPARTGVNYRYVAGLWHRLMRGLGYRRYGAHGSDFGAEDDPPREWAERLYNLHRWTPMPSGGHFAPAEEPYRLAGDIAAFFAAL
jgi:pimeloyl-ACP methyl ester carboxylesterase